MPPAISVVTPAPHAGGALARTLASVAAQSHADWEHLLVGGGPPGGSAGRLDALAAADGRVRVLRLPPGGGAPAAREAALRAARGEWVAYLDPGDEFEPGHLARLWARRGPADVLLFPYDLVGAGPGGVRRHDPAARPFAEAAARPLGVAHRRALLDRPGGPGGPGGAGDPAGLCRHFARAGARVLAAPDPCGRCPDPPDAGPPPGPAAFAFPDGVARLPGRPPARLAGLDGGVAREVFADQDYALPAGAFPRPPVVVDVGANVGAFAVYAKLAYHPDAAVHCFEPYPPSVALLRVNVAPFAGVVVHPVALGGADGEADLLLDPRSPVCHSLRADLVDGPLGRVRVPVRHAGAAWDALGLTDVDVLKLDAEGAEPAVLAALGHRLARVRFVLVEYHTPADRRLVDALLPEHDLFGAAVRGPRVGLMKYARAGRGG